jgi:CRP/FNR family cyclic AMP-dependent transcriptional regulator
MPDPMLRSFDQAPTDTPVGRLARHGTIRRFGRNVILIQEGDQGDSVFVILSGGVKVFVDGEDGREFTLGIYGPGEYIGEMSLDGGPRSASVITTAPTVCSVVTRAALTEFLRDNPEFAFDLLGRVIRRARLATDNVRSLALLDVYGRIVRLLQSESTAGRGTIGSQVPRLSHQEIANRIGCSREMVSRILKDLTKGGYVSVSKESITLLRALPSAW